MWVDGFMAAFHGQRSRGKQDYARGGSVKRRLPNSRASMEYAPGPKTAKIRLLTIDTPR